MRVTVTVENRDSATEEVFGHRVDVVSRVRVKGQMVQSCSAAVIGRSKMFAGRLHEDEVCLAQLEAETFIPFLEALVTEPAEKPSPEIA